MEEILHIRNSLPPNAAWIVWDFSANLQIQNAVNSSGSIIETLSISLLPVYCIINRFGKPTHYTFTFLCDLSKHGWNMALAASKKLIPILIELFTSFENELEFIYNYSDRSTKDFSNTSFLAFLAALFHSNRLKGSWDFTAPEEGKSWSDLPEVGIKVQLPKMRTK